MGLLYFEIDDIDRPTPPLDIRSKFHHYDHPGDDGNLTSYAEALWDRPEVDLVIAADRDPKRLAAYGERGEMVFDYGKGWRLWQQVKRHRGRRWRSWTGRPQFNVVCGALYCVDDVMRCLGRCAGISLGV